MSKKEKNPLYRIAPFYLFKGLVFSMFLLSSISGLSSIVQIYAVSNFIDYASGLVNKRVWNGEIVRAFLILVLTISIDWLIPRFLTVLEKKAEITIIQKYRPIAMQKCAKIKFEYFENDEKWNLISRVVKDPEIQWVRILSAFFTLFKLTIRILGIIVIIAKDVWWASLVILVFCIPIFAYSVRGGKKNYQAKRDASEHIRKYRYFDTILRNKEFLEERKLFGYTDRIEQHYLKSFFDAFWLETKTAIQWALKTKLSGALSMIAALIIVITLIGPTVKGVMTIGMFISLVNSVFLLTSEMSWGLSRNIDKLVSGNEYSKDVTSFFALDEDKGSVDEPDYSNHVEKIEFRDVTFKYPGVDHNILNSVSFVMEKGKKYAFVGANGAGKTTVVKLLLGLYSDYSGQILINDKELKSYSRAEQKGFFSVVFQDYIRHSLSVRESCTLADPKRTIEESEIRELLRKFELDEFVDKLPNGLDTELGKINEGGVELSGGQWQKLAMIRALLRPSEIQIMDEPTASLDPKMESEVYRMFQALADNKLTILISHRLGFVKYADEIIVFDNGSVCENGDFKKLMALNGLFAKMYEEQKKWYE